jgi:hypothetical protein
MKRGLALLGAAALATSGAAQAGAPAPTFRVTITATEKAALSCLGSTATRLTLTASLTSTGTVKATLRGGALRFSPASDIPMRTTATVDYAACGPPVVAAAGSCGTVTADIHPGGFLQLRGKKLWLSYDSNTRIFPGENTCSSGLLEMQAEAPLDAAALGSRKHVTVEGTGAYDHDFEPGTEHAEHAHIDMSFRVRFDRLA